MTSPQTVSRSSQSLWSSIVHNLTDRSVDINSQQAAYLRSLCLTVERLGVLDGSLFLGIWTDTQSSIPYLKVFEVGLDVRWNSLSAEWHAGYWLRRWDPGGGAYGGLQGL
ncbi:hypothetical protein TNCV_3324561 [Trichonephila clavipes]|nr:hypothetical protein TNCV_3324561 [Trichonephila clavipes]